jgi:hypothetical protein
MTKFLLSPKETGVSQGLRTPQLSSAPEDLDVEVARTGEKQQIRYPVFTFPGVKVIFGILVLKSGFFGAEIQCQLARRESKMRAQFGW